MTGNERELGGPFMLGPWRVRRTGYGAMQLAGDGVFGPPRDRDEALRVLLAVAAAGVNHIDTAQFYGAGTVNDSCWLMPDRAVLHGIRIRTGSLQGGVMTYYGMKRYGTECFIPVRHSSKASPRLAVDFRHAGLASTGPYGMNAAFMRLGRHERGIHVV